MRFFFRGEICLGRPRNRSGNHKPVRADRRLDAGVNSDADVEREVV